MGGAALILLAWHAAESLAIRPDYLAWLNELAGGPSQGYKHLADSSLDWGQDLPALKDWLDREGLQRGDGVYLSYFVRRVRCTAFGRHSWPGSSIGVRRRRSRRRRSAVGCTA